MKKLFLSSALIVSGISLFLVYSCTKDPNDPNAIQPTNKEESTGTAANPNIGVVTVTGTSTLTNPATNNSSQPVGVSGWNNAACITSNSVVLTGSIGNTTAVLTFAAAPPVGVTVYNLSSGTPVGTTARLTITNAAGQPSGIVWTSKSGTVQVTNGSGINAIFNNIQCLQTSFLFPVCTASGTLGCN